MRYRISDIHQLSGVKSNNDRNLCIKVADILNNFCLGGTRVQVCHPEFGVLFSYIIGARGTMVSDESGELSFELSMNTILRELKKFGFLVHYTPQRHLPGDLLEYLIELRNLSYDKLRVLGVRGKSFIGSESDKWYVVAFNVDKNPEWISNVYVSSESEFLDAIKNGTALNISEISKTKNWDWNWLDFVANIDDILQANSV